MRAKITSKTLGAQPGPFLIWDIEIKGFYARRQSENGKVTYAYRYIDAQGVKREIKIGDARSIAPEEARTAAKARAGEVAKQKDPAAERDARRAAKTLVEVWTDYERLALFKRAEGTQRLYRDQWRIHIAPALGARKINTLTQRDVEELHKTITEKGEVREPLPSRPRGGRKLKSGDPPERGGRPPKVRYAKRIGGPRAANQVVALLSILCKRAKLSPNPCASVERNREIEKDIRFSDEELTLIVSALAEESEGDQIAFHLFLETPSRHAVVACAEWEEFVGLRSADPQWRVPGAKMKSARPYVAHISPWLARRILAYQTKTRTLSPRYLFPRADKCLREGGARGLDSSKPRVTFKHRWTRIKHRALALAGPDADCRALRLGTLHTFKHTYLSRTAEIGASDTEIQAMGDHKDIRTSMRYVHRAGGRIKDLAAQLQAALPRPAV